MKEQKGNRSKNLVIVSGTLLILIKLGLLLLVGLTITVLTYERNDRGDQESIRRVSRLFEYVSKEYHNISTQKSSFMLSIQPLEPVDSTIAQPSSSVKLKNLAWNPTSAFLRFQHFEPAGCRRPPDDYSIIHVGQATINIRTYSMLKYAANIYGGSIDLTGSALTQDVYVGNHSQDLENNADAGVVDISVTLPGSTDVIYEEIDPLIKALRVAGFAAWLRDWNELYWGSEIHIHAIAIGDKELSEKTTEELIGKYGYFRGYRGLPGPNPEIDRYGAPLICQWMLDEGYYDHRSKNSMLDMRWMFGSWRDTLQEVAQSLITTSREATYQLAKDLGFQGNGYEDPSNMCGPLSATILRESGLLPWSVGPITDPTSFWLADPIANGRPWSLFPEDSYDLYHFDIPINRFDFSDWPLYPSDFVYTYSGVGEYSHMFVVTEVDEIGRAYTVTNHMQPDGHFLVEKVLLYDPLNPEEGAFVDEWVTNAALQGRTGLGGFDVLRRKWVGLPAGTILAYIVEPGDTLPRIAARFNTSVEAILSHNTTHDPTALRIGDHLAVPANLAWTGNAPYGANSDVDDQTGGTPYVVNSGLEQ